MKEKSGPAAITSLFPQVCNITVHLVSIVSFLFNYVEIQIFKKNNYNNQDTNTGEESN